MNKLTDAILTDLVLRAKLNKPKDWKTSEWDRMVDAVVYAMSQPMPRLPLTPERL